jgi:putative thioredoxin
LAASDIDGARQVLDSLDPEMLKSNDVAGAKAAVELAEQTSGADAAELEPLRRRLAENENDHQARLDLAIALFGADQREAAIDELLEIIRRDRNWNEEAARKQLLQFFDAIGHADPLTAESRRKLSSLLFS